MSTALLLIMILSIACQFIAAIMAIRMMRLSGILSAWVLLASGFIIMGLRRAVALYEALQNNLHAHLAVELMGLAISILMTLGIWKFGPVFRAVKSSHRALSERQAELEQINNKLEVEVAQRRLMEVMLQESEARYRVVADFSHDWEYWIDPDMTFKYISPYCKQVCGYDREDFFREPQLLTRIVHPDDQALFARHIHEVFAGDGFPEPIDFRIITSSGEERWIGHVCRRVVAADGTPIGQRASNRDITDRKRAEAELLDKSRQLAEEVAERKMFQEILAEKKQELESLNYSLELRITEAVAEMRQKDQFMISQSRQAAMGEMIGNIAHQWRQPLNTLSLLLANINDAYTYNELDAEFMEQALLDCNRLIQKMSTTINDFSNFFRPDKESVAFSALTQINDAIVLVEPSFKAKNISIQLDAPHDLTLFGFPNEYSQVLVNLLVNAKESILGAGVHAGSVNICLRASSGQGGVCVEDNGGGIAAEVMERIFEPYFTTKSMGTGIGLYMSKMIIEKNMNGSISVQNRAGGAAFTVAIPLA